MPPLFGKDREKKEAVRFGWVRFLGAGGLFPLLVEVLVSVACCWLVVVCCGQWLVRGAREL